MKKKRKVRFNLKRENISAAFLHMFEADYQPKKTNLYYGSSGSGKSFQLALFFVMMALKYNGFGLLVMRKVGSTMKKTIIKQFLDPQKGALAYFKLKSRSSGVKDWDYDYNKTDKLITFRNGSIIDFTGYDDPEKVKGVFGYWAAWLEEATDFSQQDYVLIEDRLREQLPANCPWELGEQALFMTFNPVYIDHWIRRYFFKEEIDKSEPIWKDTLKEEMIEFVFRLKTTWRDNKWYNGKYKNPKVIDRDRRYNVRLYEVYCNGNWGVLGDLIYNNVQIIKREALKKINFDRIVYGCDFGFAHYTGAVKVGMLNRDIFIMKEIYEPKLTGSELADEILDSFGAVRIICDSARPEMIKDLKLKGIYAKSSKKGAGSVLDGIEWLQDRRIFIVEDCIGTISEVNKYTWQVDRNGIKLPKPVKIDDDIMDAIRYAIESVRRGESVST